MSSRLPVFNSLVRLLDTVRKTMRIAYEAGDTWLVEILEQERESVAAQAAVALEEQEAIKRAGGFIIGLGPRFYGKEGEGETGERGAKDFKRAARHQVLE